MSAAAAVMIGLSTAFFGLLVLSFKLNDSDSAIYNYVGVLFMALATGLLQMIGWSALRIAEENAMTYLSDGLATPLLWILGLSMFAFWLSLLIRSSIGIVKEVYKSAKRYFGSDVGDLR